MQKTVAEHVADEITEAMEACNYKINRFANHFTKGNSFNQMVTEYRRLPSQYEMEEGLNLFLLRDSGYTTSVNHVSYNDALNALYDIMVKTMTNKLASGGYKNRI